MRRALRSLRYVERQRLFALGMLGLAAVAIAAATLLLVISWGDPFYIGPAVFGYIGAAIMILLGVAELVIARRHERRAMDRIAS